MHRSEITFVSHSRRTSERTSPPTSLLPELFNDNVRASSYLTIITVSSVLLADGGAEVFLPGNLHRTGLGALKTTHVSVVNQLSRAERKKNTVCSQRPTKTSLHVL